ncbi:MAG TPA: helix-turn-helix domain-containing protein [Candidatus Xenobia bacterium]|jgi:hypothetical protein
MIYDETRDNGWVPIRRNLLAHLEDGRLGTVEYTTLLYLLLTVSTSTGETMTCASVIADLHKWSERAVRRALKCLRENGYIETESIRGKHGLYKVRVLKFELTTGPQKGQVTTPNVSVSVSRLVRESGSEMTLKPSLTVSATETPQVTDTTPSYDDAIPDMGHDDVRDGGHEVSVSVSRLVRDVTPIQEGQADKDTENEKVCMSVGAESPASLPVQEQVPDSLRLARRFFAHQGRPDKYKGNELAWREKFDRLLKTESFDTIKAVMAWAFDESDFWPSHLIRIDQDPLNYFLSKYDKLKAAAAGHTKTAKNQAKVIQQTEKQKSFPTIKVCQRDAIAEFLAAQGGQQ